jgi:hypothetical protein
MSKDIFDPLRAGGIAPNSDPFGDDKGSEPAPVVTTAAERAAALLLSQHAKGDATKNQSKKVVNLFGDDDEDAALFKSAKQVKGPAPAPKLKPVEPEPEEDTLPAPKPAAPAVDPVAAYASKFDIRAVLSPNLTMASHVSPTTVRN